MSKTIKVRLDARSIRSAVKEIEEYKKRLTRIGKQISKELADKGLEVARIGFQSAQYDGINDSSVKIEPTDRGYKIIASGNAVAFIEFGAGVHHNPSGAPYPLGRPSWIVPIGEYGKKMGRRDSWFFKAPEDSKVGGEVVGAAKDGSVIIKTHGNPAQMPMYHALKDMQDDVLRIVREAFANA